MKGKEVEDVWTFSKKEILKVKEPVVPRVPKDKMAGKKKS